MAYKNLTTAINRLGTLLEKNLDMYYSNYGKRQQSNFDRSYDQNPPIIGGHNTNTPETIKKVKEPEPEDIAPYLTKPPKPSGF